MFNADFSSEISLRLVSNEKKRKMVKKEKREKGKKEKREKGKKKERPRRKKRIACCDLGLVDNNHDKWSQEILSRVYFNFKYSRIN